MIGAIGRLRRSILDAARAFLGSDMYRPPRREVEAPSSIDDVWFPLPDDDAVAPPPPLPRNDAVVPLSPGRRRRAKTRAALPEYMPGDHITTRDLGDPAFDEAMVQAWPEIVDMLGEQAHAFHSDLLVWAQWVSLNGDHDETGPCVASFAIPFVVAADALGQVVDMVRTGAVAASLVRHGVAAPETRFALHPDPLSLRATVNLRCGSTHRAVATMGRWIVDGEADDVAPFVADMLRSGMPTQIGTEMVGGVLVGVRVLRDPDVVVDFLDSYEPLRTRTRLHDLGTTNEVDTWIDAMASTVLDGGHHVEFGGPGNLSNAASSLSVMLVNAEFVHLAETTGADLEEAQVMFLISDDGDWGRAAVVIGEHVTDPVHVPLRPLDGMGMPLQRELSRNNPWSSNDVMEIADFDEEIASYRKAPPRAAPASRARGATVLMFGRGPRPAVDD